MSVSGGLPVNIYRGNSRRDKLLRYRFNLAWNVFAQHQNLHHYMTLKTKHEKNRDIFNTVEPREAVPLRKIIFFRTASSRKTFLLEEIVFNILQSL